MALKEQKHDGGVSAEKEARRFVKVVMAVWPPAGFLAITTGRLAIARFAAAGSPRMLGRVAANVRFAARADGPDVLERLGILHLAAARPEQLSGGERQRTGLAHALAHAPRVLILDEPFASLDTIIRQHEPAREPVDHLAWLSAPAWSIVLSACATMVRVG